MGGLQGPGGGGFAFCVHDHTCRQAIVKGVRRQEGKGQLDQGPWMFFREAMIKPVTANLLYAERVAGGEEKK